MSADWMTKNTNSTTKATQERKKYAAPSSLRTIRESLSDIHLLCDGSSDEMVYQLFNNFVSCGVIIYAQRGWSTLVGDIIQLND